MDKDNTMGEYLMLIKNKADYNWFIDISYLGQVYSLPRKWDRAYPNSLYLYFYLELPES